MSNIFLKIVAYTMVLSLALIACKNDLGDLGEERDKGKIFVVTTAVNMSRKPQRIIFKFKPLGIKPDCVITNVIDMRVMLKYNGKDIRNTPLALNGYELYRAYLPGTLTVGFDSTSVREDVAPPLKISKLIEVPVAIEADKYYSLVLVDSLQKPSTLLINDDLSLPSKGKAKVRVLNLCFDSGPIDLFLARKREGVPLDSSIFLAKNLAYKTIPNFIEVPAGLYEIQVRRTGIPAILRLGYARDLDFRLYPLDEGSVYTIWFSGLTRGSTLTPRALPDDNSNPRYNIVRSTSYPAGTINKTPAPDIYCVKNAWTVPRSSY